MTLEGSVSQGVKVCVCVSIKSDVAAAAAFNMET